jgi:hypothetical protein
MSIPFQPEDCYVKMYDSAAVNFRYYCRLNKTDPKRHDGLVKYRRELRELDRVFAQEGEK